MWAMPRVCYFAIVNRPSRTEVRVTATGSPVRVATDDGALADRLAALGHVVTGAKEAQVLVTHSLDAARVERFHAGAPCPAIGHQGFGSAARRPFAA